MRKVLFFGTMMVLFASCGQKTGTLALETREVDYADNINKVVNAQKLELSIPGINNVLVYDSLLLFTSSDLSGMLKVYNKNTLELMASFCSQGRARNEFSGNAYLINNQHYKRNGDLMLPLLDVNTMTLKEVNVSASLRDGHTVVEKTQNLSNDDICFAALGNGIDRLFLFREPYLGVDPNQVELPVYVVMEDTENVKEIKVFNRHVQCENYETLEKWYNGDMVKHPEKNLVIMTMSKMNYITFFDMDNDKQYALHRQKSPDVNDICAYKDRGKNPSYFGRSDCTPDFFMVTYKGNNDINVSSRDSNYKRELLLFDWNGNYLGGTGYDTNFHEMSYDPETHLLYAINMGSEEIFTFDLSILVSSIHK